MNRKHLLWHVFNWLEPEVIQEMIQDLDACKVRFSDDPQMNEISVAKAMKDKWEEYKKNG
jgi:hypothetical protein